MSSRSHLVGILRSNSGIKLKKKTILKNVTLNLNKKLLEAETYWDGGKPKEKKLWEI